MLGQRGQLGPVGEKEQSVIIKDGDGKGNNQQVGGQVEGTNLAGMEGVQVSDVVGQGSPLPDQSREEVPK